VASPAPATGAHAPYLALLEVFGDATTSELLSETATVAAWLEVERALAAAQAELGHVSPEAAAAVEAFARVDRIDLAAVRERTRWIGYPVLPVLEQLRRSSPPDVAAIIHWGATTQDIMDSGLVLGLRTALTRIDQLLVEVGDLTAAHADRHRATVMVGRTHAQPAVPTTFGAKVAVWLGEFARHRDRLNAAGGRVLVLSLFGAGGTSAALGPQSREIRRLVAQRLGLAAVDVPWHTARDNLAEVGFVLASIGATCGKIAREVIDLSRPEIGELREGGGDRRGASSTMPQKANPISSEVVIGMSSLVAQQVPALLAAMRGGHERAAGEWQIEWDALPTVVGLAAGCLLNTRGILAGLTVSADRMRAGLEVDGGMVMAEAVMMALAPHVGRARADDLVHAACVDARASGAGFADALQRTLGTELREALGPLEPILDPASYLGEVHTVVDAAIETWSRARRVPSAGRVRPRAG
jgi:3-carboxy-cis,cis-muconate cycloisomerase